MSAAMVYQESFEFVRIEFLCVIVGDGRYGDAKLRLLLDDKRSDVVCSLRTLLEAVEKISP